MSSARALSNGFVSNLPDFKSVAANPTIRRLFCSKAPKKESEFYSVMLCVSRVIEAALF